MFKLTVVGGPAKGRSYALREGGETSIGRVEGNDVVLQSQKVSKKHCVLVVNNKDVQVKDVGSSNGTFVNGILTKLKAIRPGDRVSVGEYVFELVKTEAPKPQPMQNVIALQGTGLPNAQGQMTNFGGATGTNASLAPQGTGVPSQPVAPQDLKEKIKFLFEKHILNFVYNLNETHQWNSMIAGMFVALIIGAACLSVYPVIDRVDGKLGEEAAGRALLLARQMVDRNAPFIYDRVESKIDVSYIEREPGVVSAYIVDMDGRVMAPARKIGQNVTEASEGLVAGRARKWFLDNDTRDSYPSAERIKDLSGDVIGVAVPLRIFSASAGKNVIVAMSLVFFDRTRVLFDGGTEALMYIQAIILSAILGVIIYFSLYRLTLRPILDLNEQIDRVLKGNSQSVEKKFKMQELEPLIDVVNTALQRAAQAGPGAIESNGTDEVLESLKFTAGRMSGAGVAIFGADKHIVHWSSYFAEVTGIHSESAVGQDVNAVARDAAFSAFCDDMFSRAPFMGSDPVSEDFEFSGVNYKLEIIATGSPGAVKYYVLTLVKPG